ncbi:MAG: NnrS family protein [Myxococcales bacterium]|nr:NnrS family protein [Myxococcales bacterium]
MRLALLQKGFRPFFLLASLHGVVVALVWVLALRGVLTPGGEGGAQLWHAHEMLFGFTSAVIAGFLLTAVGNWTGRETATGPLLAGLAALWLLGRMVTAFERHLPALASVLDLAFLPALALVLARPLLAVKNRRNFVMLAVLASLWGAELWTHFGGSLRGGTRAGVLLAVDVVVVLLVIISGRVIPMFTRNATRDETIRGRPVLDVLSILAVVLVFVADASGVPDGGTRAVAGVAAALLVARSHSWGALRAVKVPLLWILHVGHGFIPIGLALRAAGGSVPPSVGTHALTVGAIGCLTLGMMARVALGHTGRLLEPSRAVVVAFVLMIGAALARVVGVLFAPGRHATWVAVAGVLWAAAFALYFVTYLPVCMNARVDGKAG